MEIGRMGKATLLLLVVSLGGCGTRVDSDARELEAEGSGGPSTGGGAATPPPAMNSCGEPPIGGEDALIDDLEDGDGRLRLVDGRDGGWFVINDQTGTQLPAGAIVPETGEGADGSEGFVRTMGQGFSGWGAAIGVNFHGNPSCPYDASAFSGVSFYARGDSTISVQVSTAATVPIATGGDGTCQKPGGSPDEGCYGTHRKDVELSADWQHYSLSWDELVQPSWGTPAALEPSRVIALQFTVLEDEALDFDFAVDEVAFTQEQP